MAPPICSGLKGFEARFGCVLVLLGAATTDSNCAAEFLILSNRHCVLNEEKAASIHLIKR